MRTFAALLCVLPLALIGCAASPAEESQKGSESSLTGVDDLAELESIMGLVKDVDRERPEATVEAGPCFKKMEASGRPWEMRRYTKGAAFFFTKPDGTLLDPVHCVDIDTVHSVHAPAVFGGGDRAVTRSIEGVALDLVLRFRLGSLNFSTGEVNGSPTFFMFGSNAVARGGAMEIQRRSGPLGPNLPAYRGDFNGVITEVAGDRMLPWVAMLAHRYASTQADQPMDLDPVGRYVMAKPDEFDRVLHVFEKVIIDQLFFFGSFASDPGPKRPAMDVLKLTDRQTGEDLAGCMRAVEQLPDGSHSHTRDFGCWVKPSLGRWEIPWGTDFN